MSKTKEQAIEKLRDALPYFRKAVADAKKQGNVQLGVMATKICKVAKNFKIIHIEPQTIKYNQKLI